MIPRRALLATPFLATPFLIAAGPKPPLAAVPISRLQVAWWKARHEAKLAELRARNPGLIFLGDSITQNWEQAGPQPWRNFAPTWLRLYRTRNPVNLGFNGDATSHLLWRITNGELDGIAPKAAVILIGANNLGRLHWAAEDSIAGIIAVVAETRRRLPQTRLLLLGVLPSIRSDWATATTLAINAGLAKRYGGTAVPNVTYLDIGHLFMKGSAVDPAQFYDPLLTPPEPPLHPTAMAQERLALAIEPTLASLLNS